MVETDMPTWLAIAHGELGVHEITGPQHNQRVVAYFDAIGHPEVKDDETPWCAAFVGACLERAGIPSTKSAWARDYLKWGVGTTSPRPGTIVVLDRGNGYGHVGFFVRRDRDHVWLLGGNQSDQVNITSFPISRVLGYRNPHQDDVDEPMPPVPTPSMPTVPMPAPEAETWKQAEQRLQDDGSRTLDAADMVRKATVWTTVMTVAANVVNQIGESETTRMVLKLWPVLLIAAAWFVLKHTDTIKFARVDDERKKKNEHQESEAVAD